MAATTVAIAADHAGYQLQEILKRQLEDLGYGVLDLGTDGPDSVDYADFGQAVAEALVAQQAAYGVALCGTGIGISIAANRHRQVRAALCHDAFTARMSRQHNDANVLAMGARVIGEEVAKDCLREFLATNFEGGRHDRRVAKLS